MLQIFLRISSVILAQENTSYCIYYIIFILMSGCFSSVQYIAGKIGFYDRIAGARCVFFHLKLGAALGIDAGKRKQNQPICNTEEQPQTFECSYGNAKRSDRLSNLQWRPAGRTSLLILTFSQAITVSENLYPEPAIHPRMVRTIVPGGNSWAVRGDAGSRSASLPPNRPAACPEGRQ